MRRLLSTLVLLVLFVAIGGYAWFIERERPPASEADANEQAFDVEAGRITDLKVHAESGDVTVLTRTENEIDWVLTAPVETEADDNAVTAIATTLAALEIRRVVEEEVELREWSRLSEELSRERVRLANRMQQQLWRYYPQFLDAVDGDVAAPWALDLWRSLPTPRAGQRVREVTPTRVLKQHRIRRTVAATLRAKLRAPAVKVAPGGVDAAVTHVELVVERLVLVNRQLDHVPTATDTRAPCARWPTACSALTARCCAIEPVSTSVVLEPPGEPTDP